MIKMLQIGMTVKVLPDAEYGGKYTGCVGVVKNYYSSKKKAGVELEKVQNDASSKGLFWFSEAHLQPITGPMDFLNGVSKIMNAMNCRCSYPLHHTGVPLVKKVIFSGPKTIGAVGVAPKPLFPVALAILTTTTPGSVPLW